MFRAVAAIVAAVAFLQEWRSDHADWLKPDVREFRRRLERML